MNSYFICATQPTNLGDLVINKMLVDELCRYGKVFVDAYGLPEEFTKYLFDDKNAVDVYDTYHLSVKKLRLWGLSKLIKDENIRLYTHSPGPLYNLRSYRNFAFTAVNYLFKFYGVSVQCIGNCASAAIVKKMKLQRDGVDRFLLRSQESVDYADSFFPGKVSFIPDLAFLLKYQVNDGPKARKVAFNFRPAAKDIAILRKKCLDIIHEVIERGYEIVLYYQVKGDKEFMQSLYVEAGDDRVSFRDDSLWYENMDFYQDKAFVISNRLHSLLIGAVYGAIPIVFSDSQETCAKIGHVFNASFKDKSLFFMNDYEQIIDINRYVKNEAQYAEIVRKTVSENAQLCRTTIERLQ